MAGAEGIEPSARGFGVNVGKSLHRNAFRLFQPLADLRRFAPLRSDAFLMLLPEQNKQVILCLAPFVNPLFSDILDFPLVVTNTPCINI